MRTGTWNARIFSSLVVGLLVLAGICLDGRPAWAQFDCPLPAGVTAPPDPSVTAQQVEDGSATLEEFALAAIGRFKSGGSEVLTPQQLGYSGCLLRQEGGPWRSGSTYLVTLTPDGRVYLHAKNMSLSAAKLQSPLYVQILRALGTPLAVMQGLGAMDPAARAMAQSMLLAHLASEPHGPFNLGAGGSGYAGAYVSENTGGDPLVLLAGFDLNASHLAEEDIDYGDPAIRADEVVDRYTLKKFVTEALRYIIETVKAPTIAESRVAFQQARLALRDPDGPWRHGPVYVTIQDPDTDLILFHGAFPDRFELRRGGISRDVITGELIYEQLLDAADSSPQGGFWLYHFDNPSDDTDSVDVPKVGYARGFTRETRASDGTVIGSTRLVIASGFYLTSDGEFVQRILDALDDGEMSMMFGIDALEEGDVVTGDDVAISVTGAPTETVHFAYRLAGLPGEEFTYLGAAANAADGATFTWDTLDLPDDDYELVALYTENEGEEDEGASVVYDSIEVNVDNVGDGGGGCAAVPVLPGGPVDPTLMVLVGLLMVYLMFVRRRPMRQAALG